MRCRFAGIRLCCALQPTSQFADAAVSVEVAAGF
jgi:hypothetical protein